MKTRFRLVEYQGTYWIEEHTEGGWVRWWNTHGPNKEQAMRKFKEIRQGFKVLEEFEL